jgi:transposase
MRMVMRVFITSMRAAGLVEAACWAHVRRKFYDIHVANGSAIAAEAVQRIGALYDIEREVRGKPAEIRTEIRQDAVVR